MSGKRLVDMDLNEMHQVFDDTFGPLPKAVEWRRLKPSGYVHAWDVEYPPKHAVCGRENVNGTTDNFPPLAARCEVCVDYAQMAEDRHRLTAEGATRDGA
jgi:hypothetical protein